MSRPWRILLVVLVQAAALAGMIGMKMWTLTTGREVVLATTPVDPRDLFRGDYVVLSYEITLVKVDLLAAPGEVQGGDVLYVVLAPQLDGTWAPIRIEHSLPPEHEGEVAIRGTVEHVNETTPTFDANGQIVEKGRPVRLRMSYGIESYFVPEGTGAELEKLRNEGEQRLKVLVAVDARGIAAIKGLIINGERVAEEGLF